MISTMLMVGAVAALATGQVSYEWRGGDGVSHVTTDLGQVPNGAYVTTRDAAQPEATVVELSPEQFAAQEQAIAAQQGQVTSVSDFQQPLAPYGQWVNTEGGQGWVPDASVVGADFTPYSTAGHWEQTTAGWSFASDYSWGWAPFHYGRWALVPGYGWVWFPDTVWGPSWVSWRSGGGYVGWAPLVPSWYRYSPRWSFMPCDHFIRGRLSGYLVGSSFYDDCYRRTSIYASHRYGPWFPRYSAVVTRPPPPAWYGGSHGAVGAVGWGTGRYGSRPPMGGGFAPPPPPPPIHQNPGWSGGYRTPSLPPPHISLPPPNTAFRSGGFTPPSHMTFSPPAFGGGGFGGGHFGGARFGGHSGGGFTGGGGHFGGGHHR